MRERPLVERFGWTAEQVPLDSTIHGFEHLKAAEARLGTDMIKKLSYVDRSWNVAYYAYVLERAETAREWANRTGELAEDYFFGSWRDTVPSGNGRNQPPDRRWYDEHAPWVQQLQYGLVATLAVGDSARTKRIARFPFEAARPDHGIDAACDQFWLTLTRFLRGDVIDAFAFPSESKKCTKADQLLLRLLEGIARKDTDLAQRSANSYCSALTRTHAQGILLWLDASILVHLAEDCGVHLHIIDKFKDRIFRVGRLRI